MSEHLLACVHGVSSDSKRLKKLSDEVKSALGYDDVVAVNYGDQRALKAIDKQTRFLIFQGVSLSLKVARAESWKKTNADPDIDVIAHSFGTFAVVHALQFEAVEIGHLILLGCILDQWTNWDPIVKAGRVKCPRLNIVRPFDMVVRQAHFVGGDTSGSRGFSPQGRCQAIDHFVAGGHNDYGGDAKVITQFLNGSFSSKDAISEDAFKESLSFRKRAYLGTLRTFRML